MHANPTWAIGVARLVQERLAAEDTTPGHSAWTGMMNVVQLIDLISLLEGRIGEHVGLHDAVARAVAKRLRGDEVPTSFVL